MCHDSIRHLNRVGHQARRRDGMVLVWMAILIVVFVAIVALAIDWGYAYWTSQKLQNVADASALAGARQVYFNHDDARSQAIAIAGENEAGGVLIALDENADNDSDGDIIIGYYDTGTRAFSPTDDSTANAVAVNARLTEDSLNGPLGLIWGTIFGRDTAQMTRWAIAVVDDGDDDNGIIALNPNAPQSFYAHGNPRIKVNGSIQVNSSNNGAARVGGNKPKIEANHVNVTGGNNFNGWSPSPPDLFQNGVDPVVDPLAGLLPPPNGPTRTPNKITSGPYEPGYYSGGLSMNIGTVNLAPGIYVLDNGFTVSGGTLNAPNVMFYLKTGGVKITGSGKLYMSPPDSGDWKSIQFFQARTNTTGAKFTGNGPLTGAPGDTTKGIGTLYFPKALFELGGTGDSWASRIIADKVEVFGDGTKTITRSYPIIGGGDEVYLAE